MSLIKVGIIGATGYVGAELVRILSGHPKVELSVLISKSFAGKKFSDIYPSFRGVCDLVLSDMTPEQVAKNCDFVITALPHGVSSMTVPILLNEGVKVIDHSGDFRFRTLAPYTEAYQLEHPCPELLAEAVYGMPELYREKLKGARLAADPGCYPTCSILGLAPLLSKSIIRTQGIIIDAVSGYSGAGRKSELPYSYCEAAESFKPYAVSSHRHTAEIEQEFGFLAGEKILVTFTPHLAPMKRGMCATIYCDLLPEHEQMTEQDIHDLYTAYYRDEAFVRVLPLKVTPETRHTAFSNRIDIAIAKDSHTGKIKVMSALDNLGKGAASQAIQTMNVMCGFEETDGLLHLVGCI